MDIAKEIAVILANSGFGTLGTSIFVGQIPSDTDGIYIVHAGGVPNNYTPITTTYIDIYCKNKKASDCITQLTDVKNHLHRLHSTETAQAYMFSILALSDIEDVERDLEYSKIYKVTLSVMNRDKGVIS